MKIKLNRSIIVNGQHGEAGSVVETDDHAAVELINSGAAVLATEAPAVKAPVKAAPPPPAPKKVSLKKFSVKDK